MCTTCGKHNAENLWYLQEERHRIRSLGLFRDILSRNLNPLITAGLKLVRRKQPDYANSRMNTVSRGLLDWFAKTLHGMQFLPDGESAFNIIDMANELALMPCLCRLAMDPDEPPVYRCIAMNIAARIYERQDRKLDVQAIDKQQAKQLVSDWREKGAWQSVGWLWDANVIWVCNCDERCVSYRAPEVVWGGIPSFLVSTVGKRSACSACLQCANWCKHGALSFDEDGIAVVDSAACKGCGLCTEHCPTDVLVMQPRQTYYDITTKTVRHLGSEMVHLD
jgi:Pyruvate/2-oxoacid:ferredoxin oxidoreductase delta subunit